MFRFLRRLFGVSRLTDDTIIRLLRHQQEQNEAILHRLAQIERNLMATQAELAQDLRNVLAQQKKTEAEIKSIQDASTLQLQKIADLQAALDEAIANGTVSQELIDAVAAVKAQSQVVDDEIPDLPETPAPTP